MISALVKGIITDVPGLCLGVVVAWKEGPHPTTLASPDLRFQAPILRATNFLFIYHPEL